MTKSEAREAIKFASQNCEELGLGSHPLGEAELNELETEARKLLEAITAYRGAVQP